MSTSTRFVFLRFVFSFCHHKTWVCSIDPNPDRDAVHLTRDHLNCRKKKKKKKLTEAEEAARKAAEEAAKLEEEDAKYVICFSRP